MTGNVSKEELLPLVQQYLASLPPTALPVPKTARDITPLPFAYPSAPVVEDVKVGGRRTVDLFV